MLKRLLLILLLTIPAIAQAEWKYISKDKEFNYYIELNRTVSTNDSLRYADTWIKSVVHTDLTKDGLSVGDYYIFKAKIKCLELESALVAGYQYNKGKVTVSEDNIDPEYTSIIPGSFGEDVSNAVCDGLYE